MIQLSQSKINSWATCQRQFQLRYVERHQWPHAPQTAEAIEAMELGKVFHMLVAQRLMLGDAFPLPEGGLQIPLARWWDSFVQDGPKLKPADDIRVEISLSAPLNPQIKLTGRVDLLVLGKKSIEIFDWKTSKPRSKSDLEQDWQTRIYLALLYQSRKNFGKESLSAEQISINYWYAKEPHKPVKISYSDARHAENWAELTQLAQQVGDKLAEGQTQWPLTTDFAVCGRCSFSALCGRERQPVPIKPDVVESLDELEPLDLAELDVHPDL